MVTIALSLLAAVAGALIFAFASNPKVIEIGKALLWCGIFWTVAGLGGLVGAEHPPIRVGTSSDARQVR